MKLERDSSSLNFQFCKNALGPIISMDITDLDFEDADDKSNLSLILSENLIVELCENFFCF